MPADPGPGRPAGAKLSLAVLAERMAAALVTHEPGWQLPRRSVLARRYNVALSEIDAAIGNLSARHLVRCLPDGHAYRASPAEYLIRLDGGGSLNAHIDPLGAPLKCAGSHASLRHVPEDIGVALGLPPGEKVSVIKSVWAAHGDHIAICTTYLPGHLPPLPIPGKGDIPSVDIALNAVPSMTGSSAVPGSAAYPVAVSLEMHPPAPSAARTMRLSLTDLVICVTVKFENPAQRTPAALTAAVFRADMFRVVIEAPHGSTSSLSGAWTDGPGNDQP